MVLRAAFFIVPLLAWAQTPPPEVDQVLRARINEFLQNHVDGTFIKAFDLVAEDTKEYYFSAQKNKLKSFKIDSIEYSDNFTKADVQATCERMWKMSAQVDEVLVTVPMRTTWKIENGKWVYSYDPRSVRMFPLQQSAGPDPTAKPGGAVQPPPDLSPKSIAAAASRILNQGNVDKNEVTLATDKASSDQVVFHNGYEGWVQLALDPGNQIPGLSVELEKTSVNAKEDAVLKFSYKPADRDPPAVTSVRLMVLPVSQTFPILVKFTAKP